MNEIIKRLEILSKRQGHKLSIVIDCDEYIYFEYYCPDDLNHPLLSLDGTQMITFDTYNEQEIITKLDELIKES
jgi:hypothetical protein